MKENRVCYRTESSEETVALGQKLGQALQGGDLIVLAGDLGCGKTWFSKGIALGLGITEVVTSPSFALMNTYEGVKYTLFHLDVYRLEAPEDFLDAGLDECFEGGGVVVMEWGDKWPEILPGCRLKVALKIVGEQSREVVMTGEHPRMLQVLADLEQDV